MPAAVDRRVGCTLTFDVTTPASLALQFAAAGVPGKGLTERLEIVNSDMVVAVTEVVGVHGGRQHVVKALPGPLKLTYEADVSGAGGRPSARVDLADWITAVRPSRYCPSDRLEGFARTQFGDLPSTLHRVRVICAYVWQRTTYLAGSSGPVTDAVDTLLSGVGVCRDFAHLTVALCRAVQVPARVVSVYAPGLSPMDFHTVVETDIDGTWWAWDPTRLAPRPSLVRVATGRDAADVAFSTMLSGTADLVGVEVTAVVQGSLPADDHEQLVPLP
jgi:transglutaminase-like putative cysteine protease